MYRAIVKYLTMAQYISTDRTTCSKALEACIAFEIRHSVFSCFGYEANCHLSIGIDLPTYTYTQGLG
jgi:hypothetical protein